MKQASDHRISASGMLMCTSVPGGKGIGLAGLGKLGRVLVCVCVCVCSDVGEFKVGGCSSAFKCSSFTFSYLFAWHISHDICDDGRAQLT